MPKDLAGPLFFRRAFPSANMVLIRGERPVLVDSGFGGARAETERLLRTSGTPPESLYLVVNTHYHCDHSGGNHGLQSRYGIRIAAHSREAAMVNGRDPEACGARWLAQPVEPYRVDVPLSDGDEIEAGETVLRILHTPGHTLGHISLYLPEERILLAGDTFHGDDVAWINPYREGDLRLALETLDRLAKLPVRRAFSGHGPAIEDPISAIDAARRRYDKWRAEPERAAWHACKRIFAYALMIRDGMDAEEVNDYLLHSPWFDDFARHAFNVEPADFIRPLLTEMLRSGAAAWQEGRLLALFPYTPPPGDWPHAPATPALWDREPG